MKTKSIIILAALILFAAYSHSQDRKLTSFSLQAGLSPLNRVSGTDGEVYETGAISSTISFETYFYLFRNSNGLKNLGIGAGAGFYFLTSEDPDLGWMWTYDNPKGYMIHVPLYLSIKYDLASGKKFIPYIKVDNGFNFAFPSKMVRIPGDRTFSDNFWGGGYCFGLNFGVEVNKIFSLELSYNRMNSIITTDYRYGGNWYYYEDKLKTNLVSLTIGANF